MSPLSFYLWLSLAFFLGAWAYRFFESYVRRRGALSTAVVCPICKEPTLSVERCRRCKKQTCIDCRWDLLTPEPRDEFFPRARRVVCVECVTRTDEESFK